jgi:hypothetical protein
LTEQESQALLANAKASGVTEERLAELEAMINEKTWTPEEYQAWKGELYESIAGVIDTTKDAIPGPFDDFVGDAAKLLAALGILGTPIVGGKVVAKVKRKILASEKGKMFGPDPKTNGNGA